MGPTLAVTVALVLADSAVVTLALPDILRHLDTSVAQVAWVLISFNLVLGVVAVPTAVGFARTDPRILGAVGIAVFAGASAWCAVAQSIEVLIAARCVQALGGALALVGCLELLVAVYGERRGIASWITAGVIGTATGPVAGGLLTQAFSWQAIFVVQVPVAALAVPAALAVRAGPLGSGAGGDPARTASAAGTASRATGTCTTKIACHEIAWVSSPPATGPVAVPITPAVIQVAIPRRSPYTATSSSRHPTSASAPPIACTQRAPISTSIDRATAHHAEAPANTAMPTAPRIRGSARAKPTAVGTATSPSTRLNEISTQATCATVVWRWKRMSGSASVTTAESASTMATVTASREPAARRTRPSWQHDRRRPWSTASRRHQRAMDAPWRRCHRGKRDADR